MLRQRLALLARGWRTASLREFDDVRAMYVDFGFVQDDRMEQLSRLVTRLGFDLIPRERPGWDVR
jgi:hypothetical protein